VLATTDLEPGPRFPALSASLQAHRVGWLFPRVDTDRVTRPSITLTA